MDSRDDTEAEFDIDRELAAWMSKEADELGIDAQNPYAGENDMIAQYQQNPTPEGFSQLYGLHQGIINRAASRYLTSTTLPKAAVRGEMIKHYSDALATYNPSAGAQFKSHVFNKMQRVGRYTTKYSNVGRIVEQRANLIGLLQTSERGLTETLGRPPSDVELADDMLVAASDLPKFRAGRITPKSVGTLRTEVRADWTAESAGGSADVDADSDLRRQVVFLHGSLNADQQKVLEHTFEGFGKITTDNDNELAQHTGMTPQKVRALKSQIHKKVLKFWKEGDPG